MANGNKPNAASTELYPLTGRKMPPGLPKVIRSRPKQSYRGQGIPTVLRILDVIRRAAPKSLEEVQKVRRKEILAIAEERDVTDVTISDICWRCTNADGSVRAFDELVWRWLSEDDPDLQERLRTNSKKAGDSQRIAAFFNKRGSEQDGYFTRETFDTLEALEAEPTAETYNGIKDRVQEHVIDAVKSLFADVTAKLPESMTRVLETEKDIFSRIRKNDYGRGGIHPNFWGAYTLKGRKRTTSAQLFVFLYSGGVEFGFYIGQNSDESLIRIFGRRCKENPELVDQILTPFQDDADFYLSVEEERGGTGSDMEVEQWIEQGAKKNYRACVWLSPEDVLGVERGVLSTYVLTTFRDLFPLMLLTDEKDQLDAVKAYLTRQPEPSLLLNPPYTLADIEKETLVPTATLERWVQAIKRKGQAVFYGPPGTGKTFLAQRLAKHLKDGGDGFVELVQFHPSYAYEDFMEGIRPLALTTQVDDASETQADGVTSHSSGFYYDMVPGRFLTFCEKARKCTGPCVLIIDEINRAELSRVFGELMYLLEYRPLPGRDNGETEITSIPLAGGKRFYIPPNVFIIGTMNTADRSIALVDHALRRRFAFIAIDPDYELLRRYHRELRTGFPANELVKLLVKVNAAIGDSHYALGVSFFLKKDLPAHIKDIWELEIEPYLEEYFFDRRKTVEDFRWGKVEAALTGAAGSTVNELPETDSGTLTLSADPTLAAVDSDDEADEEQIEDRDE